MDVLVSVQHPAHVHFYRHAIAELRERGHDVHVFAVDKDVTVDLLEAHGVDHTVLAERSPGGSVPRAQATYEYRLWRAARRIEPDVATGIGGVAASHVATLVGARGVVFTDTEHATLSNRLAFPFADRICTPTCYRDRIGPKQYAYPGYHELAYLHPDRFTPDPDALADLDVDPDDTFVVFRLVRWDAMHNAGGDGFEDAAGGVEGLRNAIERLEATGADVLITSEKSLPPALEEYRATVATHRMHDLLAHADLFLGESGTMTAESAVLGTPSIYVHENDTGLTDDLAEYGLVYPFHGPDRHEAGLEKAVAVLEGREDADWGARRERLLADRRDTTDVIVERLLHEGTR
ncbi:DUF354 domain-containing protein [Halorarum salinum]|uniref:DUF354 domain-containing protein n=1 Tax=Halorarum salinum TaxID=2743089 RepID=A0A7D5QEB1_9EURY|nr:DUF354 domain-containing protein [Halobaculum salinum]